MIEELTITEHAIYVGVAMMDEQEAREYLKMMSWDLEAADSALTNFRARALDFAEREGWRALGYAGALEALQTELGAQHSKSYLSRILQAGEIERVLDLPIGQLPERTIRPLSQLGTPDQQRQAYQAVVTNGKPTAEKMQQAVDQIKPPAPDLPPLPSEDEQHRITIEAILKQPHTPALIQQAYDHAAEIHDLTLHNRMIALIDRATDEPSAPATGDPLPPKLLALALSDLDATLPADLVKAGYYWQSAAPPTIKHNDGWSADAPTVDQALACARLRIEAKGAPITITLALSPMECKALLREAAIFLKAGGDRRFPTIWQALTIAVAAASPAT